jgi:BCD family chlorophyll transporter-like MFS transporter
MNNITLGFNLARLSLFQISFGIIYAILTDTLNRVMTIELGIAAVIVGGLIGIREMMAFLGVKIWAGNLSDRTRLFGYRRLPFILGGLLLSCVSFSLIAPAAFAMKANFWLSLIELIVIFTVFGIGYHAALTTYYALISDYAGEKNLSKVAAVSWCLMVLTGIITAIVMGNYLKEFTNEKLATAMQTASLIAFVIGFLTIIGLERRSETVELKTEESLSFAQSLQLINDSPITKAFAVYIFISIFAAFGHELIMEPFGADVLGLSVAETTKFRQYLGSAQLVFMLLTGFFINRMGIKNAVFIGNAISTLGFVMLVVSGITTNVSLLYSALITLGVGLGLCTIGNIVFMISMHAGRTGLYIGLWGTAQSVAMFSGDVGMGAVRDVLMHSASPMIAYGVLFLIVIGAFTISTAMLPRFSIEKFEEESRVSLEKILAVAGD